MSAGGTNAGWSLSVLCLFLVGCQQAPVRVLPPLPSGTPDTSVVASYTATNKIDPVWLQPPAEPFTLGPGDRVDIEVLGEPASKEATTVGPDGKLYFSLLSELMLPALTLAQTKEAANRAMLLHTITCGNHPGCQLFCAKWQAVTSGYWAVFRRRVSMRWPAR